MGMPVSAPYEGIERRAAPRGPQDLERANRDLLRRSERLEAAMREFEVLAHAVHHDFRAPLTAIEAATRSLGQREMALDQDMARAVRAIRTHLDSMRAMTTNLVELSRLSGQELDIASVDMEELVREAWACVHATRKVHFNVGRLPAGRCHRGMLKLVWTILLNQAVAHSASREHPRIDVTGGGSGEFAVYGVRDNGRDLDLGVAGKLVNVFGRIQSQASQPGIGVGLAIVQRIITRHRGNVWAEARPDDGALFQFSLPVDPPSHQAAPS
jgi:light-regulated signal transduction histidine kinase (bacteriophytochrome)